MLAAGLNPVCTDTAAVAVAEFGPMATRGTLPFERWDSTVQLAEQAGLGGRELRQIELLGVPVREAVVDNRKHLNTA